MNKKKFAVILAIALALAAGYYIGSRRPASDDSVHLSRSAPAAAIAVTSAPRIVPALDPPDQTYILNTSTKKFHKPSCSSVKQMKDKNKKVVTLPRQEIIDQGYDPCGRCHP